MAKFKHLVTMLLCGVSTFSIQQSPVQTSSITHNHITRQAMNMTWTSFANSISKVIVAEDARK